MEIATPLKPPWIKQHVSPARGFQRGILSKSFSDRADLSFTESGKQKSQKSTTPPLLTTNMTGVIFPVKMVKWNDEKAKSN